MAQFNDSMAHFQDGMIQFSRRWYGSVVEDEVAEWGRMGGSMVDDLVAQW
jgi:hypothetical protein